MAGSNAERVEEFADGNASHCEWRPDRVADLARSPSQANRPRFLRGALARFAPVDHSTTHGEPTWVLVVASVSKRPGANDEKSELLSPIH